MIRREAAEYVGRMAGSFPVGDVASKTVIYSGKDLPNGKSAGYFHFASLPRRMKDLSLL